MWSPSYKKKRIWETYFNLMKMKHPFGEMRYIDELGWHVEHKPEYPTNRDAFFLYTFFL